MNKFLVVLALLILSSQALAGIKFGTYNIRNFDYDERSHTPTNKSHLVNTISEISPDLLAVQEINNTFEFQKMININFMGEYASKFTECGGAHSQKLGFVYKPSKLSLIGFEQDMRTVNPKNPHQASCNSGSRPLAVGIFKTVDTKKVIVAISVHLKSGGRANSIEKRFMQLKLIKDLINEYRNEGYKNFVIMGDFNSTEYIVGGKIRAKFRNVVDKMDLRDLTSGLSCTAYWWGGVNDSKQYPSTLDHILVSPSLVDQKDITTKAHGHCAKLQCESTYESEMGVDFDGVSDHCPIVSEVK